MYILERERKSRGQYKVEKMEKKFVDEMFAQADTNGNGKIEGEEAVKFFYGANMDKMVLAQVQRN